MAFEMSLPHAPRLQTVGADGSEQVAQDEAQWQLYFTVQRALQQQQQQQQQQQVRSGLPGGGCCGGGDGGEGGQCMGR